MGEVKRILLARALGETMISEVRSAHPEEACGLLIGHFDGDVCRIVRAEPSSNVASGDRTREFEIDPKVQIELMRELRGSDLDVIGVYHSHPDGAAEPSAVDKARADEPGFIWVIVAGNALHAYVALGGGRGFRKLEFY